MSDLDAAEMEAIEETARRIAAAVISVRSGLSLHYCYQRYAKDAEPGEHWVYLAIMARKMMEEANNDRGLRQSHVDVRPDPTTTTQEKKQ